MDLQPLADRVLVKPEPPPETTEGGLIHIPENARNDRPWRGEVIAVGPGKTLKDGAVRPIAVKPGDTVYYGKFVGHEVRVDGEDYVIMREDDLLGVIPG